MAHDREGVNFNDPNSWPGEWVVNPESRALNHRVVEKRLSDLSSENVRIWSKYLLTDHSASQRRFRLPEIQTDISADGLSSREILHGSDLAWNDHASESVIRGKNLKTGITTTIEIQRDYIKLLDLRIRKGVPAYYPYNSTDIPFHLRVVAELPDDPALFVGDYDMANNGRLDNASFCMRNDLTGFETVYSLSGAMKTFINSQGRFSPPKEMTDLEEIGEDLRNNLEASVTGMYKPDYRVFGDWGSGPRDFYITQAEWQSVPQLGAWDRNGNLTGSLVKNGQIFRIVETPIQSLDPQERVANPELSALMTQIVKAMTSAKSRYPWSKYPGSDVAKGSAEMEGKSGDYNLEYASLGYPKKLGKITYPKNLSLEVLELAFKDGLTGWEKILDLVNIRQD